MPDCRHEHLTLLMPSVQTRLRCRHCALTIAEEEVRGGHCPECLEAEGRRRSDFDRVEVATSKVARLRCEACGLLMDA